jgi:tetratricopeptide (TPR) repeat protein
MAQRRPRKEQLERLLLLARDYRGWSARELARALERDPHNVVPPGGVPRLDLVLRVAEVLDWPVDCVIDDLCKPPVKAGEALPSPEEYSRLTEAAYEAIRASRHAEGLEFIMRARMASSTPDERAYTFIHEYRSLELQGRYGEAIECARRGLRIARPTSRVGCWLRGYLASSHLIMGDAVESMGLATHLVDHLSRMSLDETDRALLAMALSVRGQSHRALAVREDPISVVEAQQAVLDLEQAATLFRQQARRREVPTDVIGAEIADAARLEARVLLGDVAPAVAVPQVLDKLEEVPPPGLGVGIEWPIALGWWCIHGCNIVLRAMHDLPDPQQTMAVLTNKADECAAISGNWALRERVWMIEHYRRRDLEGANARGERWVLDREELATLTGAMGRFPAIRELGWRVLDELGGDDRGQEDR